MNSNIVSAKKGRPTKYTKETPKRVTHYTNSERIYRQVLKRPVFLLGKP